MKKRFVIFIILILSNALMLYADTGSAESGSGSLTSLPPSAPALKSPADGATGILSTELIWHANTHTSSYNLQVSKVEDFSSTITDEQGLTDTTFTVSGLSGETTYYWHVSATNVAGTGSYSETWEFTTDAAIFVSLSAFSAEPAHSGVLVKWTTESEINVAGFILERSTGLDNPQNWQVLASFQTHDALKSKGDLSSRAFYEFQDKKVESGNTYHYRLSEVSLTGNVFVYDTIQIQLPTISSTESASNEAKMTLLEPPLPNPFNPQTTIRYNLAKGGHVDIDVFDVTGRKIRTLICEYQTAGRHTIHWTGRDNYGTQMASGAYLIVMRTKDHIQKHKVILLH